MSDKETPSRCFFCKKKQLILVDCYCKRMFCLKDRMPEDHKCEFNYKECGMNTIRLLNPKIEFQKLEKI
jgi:predicted nucleic acid binding AN1-type Zn finger protein